MGQGDLLRLDGDSAEHVLGASQLEAYLLAAIPRDSAHRPRPDLRWGVSNSESGERGYQYKRRWEAYMVGDAVLLLVEAQRGDAAPAPDLLVRELQRAARRHLALRAVLEDDEERLR